MRSMAIVALAVSVSSGCEAMLSKCEERVVGDTYFIGRVKTLTREVTYFAMVFQPSPGQSIVPGPAAVRVGNHTTALSGVTPNALLATGFPRVGTHPRWPSFGISCPDAETGGAGLGIAFDDQRLANVHANNAFREPCDFAIKWEGHEFFSLPINSIELMRQLPSVGVVQECRPLF